MNFAGVRKIISAFDLASCLKDDGSPDIRRLHRLRKWLLRWIAIVVFPLFLVHRSSWPADSVVDETLTRVGALLIGIAVAGRTWVWGHLGRQRHTGFVSDGPYSVARHPLYALSMIGVAGVAAQSGSIVMTVTIMAVIWFVFDRVAKLEDVDMSLRFGEVYEAYRRQTPCFVPDLRRWTAPQYVAIEYGILLNCLRSASVFMLAIPLFILIDLAQRTGFLPVLFRLP